MRISDWSSDVCSSDLSAPEGACVGDPATGRFEGAACRRCGDRKRRHQRGVLSFFVVPRLVRGTQGGLRLVALGRPGRGRATTVGRWWRDGTRGQIGRATSELHYLMRRSYAVFCLRIKNIKTIDARHTTQI